MNRPHYTKSKIRNGTQEVRVSSWKWFGDYVQKELTDFKSFIFRGHRKASWNLESTLDRAIAERLRKDSDAKPPSAAALLERFRTAIRGRRGPNPQALDDDYACWALGQHHGLDTPLLDWTESPFVAAYFAFFKPADNDEQLGDRAVWALNRTRVKARAKELRETGAASGPAIEVISFVQPLQDDNARLVNQSGLFTHVPRGQKIEEWVSSQFNGFKSRVLVKITIPEKTGDRADFLQVLNRMNINHLSLFPDLYGSAMYCNTALRIRRY